MPTYKIAVLPGDGVGKEVIPEALKILGVVSEATGIHFEFEEALIGGAAIDAKAKPLPEETLRLCAASHAVLFGAVGGPKWESLTPDRRPEFGLLRLRKELDLYANLRPAKCYSMLADASPLKRSVVEGADVLVVRELTGGLYFGEPRGIKNKGTKNATAVNTLAYSAREIERVARVAFEASLKRKKRLTSVDKANVLEVSQLWRQVVTEIGKEYPQVKLEHVLVDTCAMTLASRPTHYDTILTENMFGDILSDEAAIISASMGMLPSASLGDKAALYEPIHGSAPDIAGKNVANPIATILSVAMMLRYSLDRAADAEKIEAATEHVLKDGYRTADIRQEGTKLEGTRGMSERIARALDESYDRSKVKVKS